MFLKFSFILVPISLNNLSKVELSISFKYSLLYQSNSCSENFDGEELTSDKSKKSISSCIVNFSTSSFAHPSLTM